MMGELSKRLLTVLVVLPFLFMGVFWWDWVLFVMLLVAANCIAFELLVMAKLRGIPVYRWWTFLSVSVIVSYFYCVQSAVWGASDLLFWAFNAAGLEYHFVPCVFFLSCFVVFALRCFSKNLEGSLEAVAVHTFTLGYAGVALGYAIWVHFISPWWFVYLLCVTWMTDIGAYFGGKYLGKHSLNLKVSPNKTLEGFVVGLGCAVLSGSALKVFAPAYEVEVFLAFGWPSFLFVTAGLSVLAILGDLAESCLKRSSGVKDSQSYIPGHGGMMDALDSLVYTAPVLYFLLHIFKTKVLLS